MSAPSATTPLFLDIAAPSNGQRAENRTDAHERQQIAISFRAAMEDVFDKDRNVSAHRHAQEGHAERQDDQRFHRILAADELDALFKLVNIDSFVFCGRKRVRMMVSETMGARNDRRSGRSTTSRPALPALVRPAPGRP
jgi:hypothetical protein